MSEEKIIDKKESDFSKMKKKIFKCEQCETLKKETAEYKAGWQRALADYKNLQDSINEWRVKMIQISEVDILEKFIPVYENFKKAFALPSEDKDNSWREGIGYIMKQFGEVLKSYNVEEIKTVGEKVDLNLHEIVGEQEIEGKDSGEIIQEVSGGYKKNERVMIPARVIVIK
jgi:molecular chaperone GrpE